MATYTVGQVLPNGYTVTSDTVVAQADGTTVETIHSHLDTGRKNPDGSTIFSTQSEVITTPGPGTPADNAAILQSRAAAALVNNATYLAFPTPTTAENTAQVHALTRQVNAVIKLALGLVSDTTGNMTIAEAEAYVGTSVSDGPHHLELLVREGLAPESSVLEIGCGTLHLARILVPWLEANRYDGVDPNEWLRVAALEDTELRQVCEDKGAHFSSREDFVGVDGRWADFIFAHSVLTHCSDAQVDQFMAACHAQLAPGGKVLASAMLAVEDEHADEWTYPDTVRRNMETLAEAADAHGLVLSDRYWSRDGLFHWVVLCDS